MIQPLDGEFRKCMRNLLIAEKIMNRKNWLANKPRPVSPFLLLDRSVQERQAQAEAIYPRDTPRPTEFITSMIGNRYNIGNRFIFNSFNILQIADLTKYGIEWIYTFNNGDTYSERYINQMVSLGNWIYI